MNRRKFLGMLGLGAAVGLAVKAMPMPPANRMPYFVGAKSGKCYFSEPAISPYSEMFTAGQRVQLFLKGELYAFNGTPRT
jgi:hypothetical protein